MRKLRIIVVIVVFVAVGTLSSVLSPVSAKNEASTTPRVQLAQTGLAPLTHSSLSRVARAPLGSVAGVALTVPEPVLLFLLGSGLISAGALVRRRIRS